MWTERNRIGQKALSKVGTVGEAGMIMKKPNVYKSRCNLKSIPDLFFSSEKAFYFIYCTQLLNTASD